MPDESRAPSPFVTVLAHVGQQFPLRLGPVDGCNSTSMAEFPQSVLCKLCRVEQSGLVLADIICLDDTRAVEYRFGQVGVDHFANNTTHKQVRFLIKILDVGDFFVPCDIWLSANDGHDAVGVPSRAGDDP